jgi:hypothetical protein
MVATNGRTVTVFGGTGFLGRRIVRHLRSREFPVRIASRHPDRGYRQFGPDDPQLRTSGTWSASQRPLYLSFCQTEACPRAPVAKNSQSSAGAKLMAYFLDLFTPETSGSVIPTPKGRRAIAISSIGQQHWLDQHCRQSQLMRIGDRWPDTLVTHPPTN